MNIFKMRPVWAAVIEHLDHCELSQLRLVNKWFSKFKNTKQPEIITHINFFNYRRYKNSQPTSFAIAKYEINSGCDINTAYYAKYINELVSYAICNSEHFMFLRLMTFFNIDYELAFKIACEEKNQHYLEFIYSQIRGPPRESYMPGPDDECTYCWHPIRDHFNGNIWIGY